MQIRAASIRYASTKKLHLKQKELSLEEEIVIIEKILMKETYQKQMEKSYTLN